MLRDHIEGKDDGGQGEGEGRRKGREKIPPLISQHKAKAHPLGRAESKTKEVRQPLPAPLLRHCAPHGFRRMDLQNAPDSRKNRCQTYHQREEGRCRPALPVIMQLSFRKIVVQGIEVERIALHRDRKKGAQERTEGRDKASDKQIACRERKIRKAKCLHGPDQSAIPLDELDEYDIKHEGGHQEKDERKQDRDRKELRKL